MADLESMGALLPSARQAGVEPPPMHHWAGTGVRLAHFEPGFGADGPTIEPATHASAELTIVGDIRLRARGELVAATGWQGSPGDDDRQLVLAAYRKWGDRFLDRLTGDFAFALWDGRRRLLTCARDPFGTRPLYYHLTAQTFAFASDPEAVMGLPGVPRRLDGRHLVDYLWNRYEDDEATAWRDVRRLPPGSALVVGMDRAGRQRFWHPESVPELRLGSDAEYEEAFRAALREAVGARLSGTGMGVYLSGGLDSSSVACVAASFYRGGRLAAFSALFDLDRGSDERAYAAATAERAGADLHPCRAEDTSPLANWQGAPWSGPAPACSPQVGLLRAVTDSSVEHGARVLLTGFGGDSVVSHGTAYLTELAASGRPGRFLVEARALGRRHRRPLGEVIWKFGVRPFVPDTVIRARRRLRREDLGRGGVKVPVRPEVIRSLRLDELIAEDRRRPVPRTARQAHLADLTGALLPYALESSFHTDVLLGVERRHPFLDQRLAELCIALPGDQKLRDGWTRSIMRRALVGVLPDVVRQRPGKADLSPPFVRALLGADGPALEALVARPGPVTEWVDPDALTTLWHRCLSERRTDDCFTMWRVAVLSRWLAHHGVS